MICLFCLLRTHLAQKYILRWIEIQIQIISKLVKPSVYCQSSREDAVTPDTCQMNMGSLSLGQHLLLVKNLRLLGLIWSNSQKSEKIFGAQQTSEIGCLGWLERGERGEAVWAGARTPGRRKNCHMFHPVVRTFDFAWTPTLDICQPFLQRWIQVTPVHNKNLSAMVSQFTFVKMIKGFFFIKEVLRLYWEYSLPYCMLGQRRPISWKYIHAPKLPAFAYIGG